MKILHVISGLEAGGAEKVFVNYLKFSKVNRHYVIVLSSKAFYSEEVRAHCERIIHLPFSLFSFFTDFFRALRFLLLSRVDIVLGWLVLGQIFSFFLAKLTESRKVVFMVRQSLQDYETYSFLRRQVYRLNIFLMNKVDLIVFNSHTAQKTYALFGVNNRQKSVVIHNGVDLDNFAFCKTKRSAIRKSLHVTEKQIVFLWVGRWEFEKGNDYAQYICEELLLKNPNAIFLFVGKGVPAAPGLIHLRAKYGRIILNEATSDISGFFSAADTLICTSRSESCPNVVLEARVNGLNVVSFDVGDVKHFLPNENVVSIDAPSQIISKLVRIGHIRSDNAYEGLDTMVSSESFVFKNLENTLEGVFREI